MLIKYLNSWAFSYISICRYDSGKEWDLQYKNYDKLMEYINSHPELNAEVQFGTLADYFNSVNADSKSLSLIEKKDPEHFFPTLSGDFFTYADRDDHYWSGTYLFHKEFCISSIIKFSW